MFTKEDLKEISKQVSPHRFVAVKKVAEEKLCVLNKNGEAFTHYDKFRYKSIEEAFLAKSRTTNSDNADVFMLDFTPVEIEFQCFEVESSNKNAVLSNFPKKIESM